MKKILMLFAAMLVAVNAFAADIPEPETDFYVNDFANVLSNETKTYMVNASAQLAEQTNAQIVVTTILSADGENIESYSLRMAREWGIGGGDENNGVLILVATEDRKSRIEVGRGLEGALPDGKTGRIQDEYMITFFAQGDYEAGIRAGFDAVMSVVCDEYGIELPDGCVRPEGIDDDSDMSVNIFGVLAIVLLVIIISSHNKGGKNGTRTTWTNSGNLGGGFGGSGGRGGFSGGGGGFSGGGSSRGW
ncbi:MAG: TPM domain-containing protein [Clostridia bacterium]|nr:TPM domain-containing protein [Clostridia bacterium]